MEIIATSVPFVSKSISTTTTTVLTSYRAFFFFFSEHCSIVLQLDVTVKYIRKKKQINYYYLLGQIVIWKKRQTKNYRFIDAQYKLLRRVNNE